MNNIASIIQNIAGIMVFISNNCIIIC